MAKKKGAVHPIIKRCINCANASNPKYNPVIIECSVYKRNLVANSQRGCEYFLKKR